MELELSVGRSLNQGVKNGGIPVGWKQSNVPPETTILRIEDQWADIVLIKGNVQCREQNPFLIYLVYFSIVFFENQMCHAQLDQ